jgi:hypothetical protein
MAINYITTANTFQQWLIGTQDLITVANNLTDNISGTFYANTNLIVGNTLTVVGNTTLSNANVTNTLTANVANVNTFIGTANTAIYAAISAAANSGSDSAVALAIALG